MKKWFERVAPSRDTVLNLRWLSPFAHRLTHPIIWHFNRHNIARGVALGLFVGFLIPIGQIAAAALLALSVRGNLLVAALVTFVTNPLTFPPIYYAAYRLGTFLIDAISRAPTTLKPSMGFDAVQWLASALVPTALGLLIFGCLSSLAGFTLVHVAWRLWLGRQWRRRRLN